ncbi:MAG TPA: 3-deoxy-D-manno-octulosonic acid transferase, partial [Chitinophagaceae bacterium]|nr:3-deoxy-D-manno-octulosonic acid transferase [Chitinophagaceae bacterium]
NIGMLSRLYSDGKIAYIGGGFGKGIHNTLEAAVYGMPVLFGPAFQKFKEAKDLVANGAALPVANDEEAVAGIQKLLADATLYSSAAAAAAAYVQTSTGATRLITGYIQEKRLLTS